MTCPICGERTLVINSASDCECVYRRRRCVECQHTFTTTEQESNDTKILNLIRKAKQNDKA